MSGTLTLFRIILASSQPKWLAVEEARGPPIWVTIPIITVLEISEADCSLTLNFAIWIHTISLVPVISYLKTNIDSTICICVWVRWCQLNAPVIWIASSCSPYFLIIDGFLKNVLGSFWSAWLIGVLSLFAFKLCAFVWPRTPVECPFCFTYFLCNFPCSNVYYARSLSPL